MGGKIAGNYPEKARQILSQASTTVNLGQAICQQLLGNSAMANHELLIRGACECLSVVPEHYLYCALPNGICESEHGVAFRNKLVSEVAVETRFCNGPSDRRIE
jgi:hypothetical protein